MLNSNVNALGDESVSDLLINNNADRARIDVENATSSSVIILIRHAFMDGTIDNDVNDVTDFVARKSFGDVDRSMLLESFSKFVSCSASLSVAVSHL